MDITLLKRFAVVAEEQNVSRAAARLRIAQPALSRQMRALENELGVTLFDRGGRSITLTQAGQYFLREAQELTKRINTAINSVRQYQRDPTGEFHVGYVPALTRGLLPKILQVFCASFPRLRISLHDLSTDDMADQIVERNLDVALMVKPSAPRGKQISFHEINRIPCSVIMPADHPLSELAEVSGREVADYPLLAFRQNGYSEYLEWLEGVLGEGVPFRIYAECDTVPSMIALLEAGLGLAIVQEGFEKLSDQGIISRPIRNASLAPVIFGAAKNPEDVSAPTRHFMDLASRFARFNGKVKMPKSQSA